MAPMTGRTIVSENVKTILICVNSYKDLLMKGMVYHASFSDGKPFANLMQLILIVESILDDTEFPRATTEKRRFHSFKMRDKEIEIVDEEHDFDIKKGKLATFKLRIMFRHNASWQGSVAWMEDNVEEPFRSALELLMLMDSALSS